MPVKIHKDQFDRGRQKQKIERIVHPKFERSWLDVNKDVFESLTIIIDMVKPKLKNLVSEEK